jgi:hypothetical protein
MCAVDGMLGGELGVHVLQGLHDTRPMPRLTVKHKAQLLFKTIALASHRFHVPNRRRYPATAVALTHRRAP